MPNVDNSAVPGPVSREVLTQADVARILAEHVTAIDRVTTTLDALARHSAARLALNVFERIYQAASGVPAQLDAPAQSLNLERITSAIVSTPAGATAITLNLAGELFPIPAAGLVILQPLSLILQPGSPRRLTFLTGANGAAALWLFGEEIPTDKGVY